MYQPLAERLRLLPDQPGVYVMRDGQGDILYVGKAKSLKNRVRSYFQPSAKLTPKVAALVEHVRQLDWYVADTPLEALMLECTLIKKHQPHYNILLKDGKQYPYIRIDLTQPWPKATLAHRRQADGAAYFGPYIGGGVVREVLDHLGRVYSLRTCKKTIPPSGGRDRPCLQHQIGRCTAPCAGRVTREEYLQQVARVVDFLQGNGREQIEQLRDEMLQASEKMEFERAARLRDRLTALESLMEKQRMVLQAGDQDVIAVAGEAGLCAVQVMPVRGGRVQGGEWYILHDVEDTAAAAETFVTQYYQQHPVPREVLLAMPPSDPATLQQWLRVQRGGAVSLIVPRRGEKYRLCGLAQRNAQAALGRAMAEEENKQRRTLGAMQSLQQLLGLPSLPRRIEGFDISHTQGQQQVGSMVVFYDGMPSRKDYRHFRIRRQGGADDYASMYEIVSRRLNHIKQGDERFGAPPDVLLIDGGIGQLHAAQKAMRDTGVSLPLFALAERLEEIFVPGRRESILLPDNHPARHLVQRVRDEAHRFAITHHRGLRAKSALQTRLESIPGVGPARRKALLAALGSEAAIRKADLNTLCAVPGFPRTAAEAVYRFYHEDEQPQTN